MDFSPITILADAQKAVPAVKYAAGVAGLAAVVAIVAGFQIDFRIAVFGTIIVLGLMFALVVFGALAAHAGPAMIILAMVAAWCFLILTVITATLLMTSYFFTWPRPIGDYLPQRALVDYERTVDFSKLRCLPDGTKEDLVIFTDIVTFVGGVVPQTFRRPFNMTSGAHVSVRDLVSGQTFEPKSVPGGAEGYGEVTFAVDKKTHQARFEWHYKNAHSSQSEGVGFSSAEPFLIRTVDVNYVPTEIELKAREFTPIDLEGKCIRKRAGFRCENLLADKSFRETWQWDIWKMCP